MNRNQSNMNHFWDLSLEILCLIDFENRFQDISPAFERVLGYTKDEVRGKLFTDFLHPDDMSATLAEAKQIPLGYISRHFENRYRHKDGSYIWLSWNSIPVMEEGLTYAIARDITWRKQAEAKLRESEERFSQAFYSSPIGLVVSHLEDGIIEEVNESFEYLLGLKRQEIIGHSITELNVFIDADQRHDMRQAILEAGRVLNKEVTAKTREGNLLQVLLSSEIIQISGKRMLLTTVIDITARKQAEEALKENEEKLRLMFESVNDAITVTDLNGRIIQCNEATANMHSYTSRQEVIGLKALELIAKGDRLRAIDGMKRTLEQGNIKDIHYLFLDKNGREFHGELSASVIKDTIGNPAGFIAITKDITARQQTEEALKQSEEKYRSLFESMSEAFVIGEVVPDGKGEPFDYRFLEVNKAWEKITNISRNKAIGRTYRELFPRPIEDFIQKHNRVALTGEPTSFEFYSPFLNLWFSFYVYSPTKGKFASISIDITERKKAETNLQNDLSALTRIHTLSSKLLETGGYQSLLQDIMEAAVAIMKAQSGTLQLLEGNVLRVAASYGLPQPFLDFFNKLENVQTVFVEATYSGDRVIIPDIETSPLVMGHPSYAVLHEAKVRTVQSTPMVSRSGKLLGVLATHWEVPFTPAEEDLWRLDLLVRQATDLIEQSQARKDLIKAKEELEIKVKERTQELTESEEKYRKVVENANELIVVFQKGIKFINDMGLKITGYSREELLSRPFTDFIHPADKAMIAERSRKRSLNGIVPSTYEFRMIHKDGSIKWLAVNAVSIQWQGKPAILGLMSDITSRKNMEDELKNYAQKITQVQEEERKRIAYELHDDTAQYLAILKLQLDSIIQSGQIQSPEILEKLQYLEKDAGRAVDDVRRYSHELRPGVLEHLGLVAALEQISEDINKLKQLEVEVTVKGEERPLTEEVKLGFFRIAQEALNNSRKHSKALKANVILEFRKNRLEMVIRDDGIGFDIQEVRGCTGLRGSLGLMSMQERAKLIGANLKIESKPGQGTSVKVEMPLPHFKVDV